MTNIPPHQQYTTVRAYKVGPRVITGGGRILTFVSDNIQPTQTYTALNQYTAKFQLVRVLAHPSCTSGALPPGTEQTGAART